MPTLTKARVAKWRHLVDIRTPYTFHRSQFDITDDPVIRKEELGSSCCFRLRWLVIMFYTQQTPDSTVLYMYVQSFVSDSGGAGGGGGMLVSVALC